MGLNIRAVYAWYCPDTDIYGIPGGTSDGAGMLELDNTVSTRITVEVLSGAPAHTAKPIRGAIWKDFSQTVKTDEVQGTTRLIYINQVQAEILIIPRIDLQLYTVVDTVNSTFKFRLNDDDTEEANDSASSFSYGHGNQYDLLWTTDGVHWILYVDGVEEIRVAHTRRMGVTGGSNIAVLRAAGSDDSGNSETRCGGYAYVEFDGSPDRPDVSATVFAELTLAGESATYTDYIDGQGGPNGHPLAANVDDWESGAADDDTTVDSMTAEVGATKLQAYTTPTYTVVNDHVSVVIQARERANTGSKFGSGNLFVYDGSNITHAANTIPIASWQSYRRMFPFAPDGSTAWASFSSWAGLELGHRTITDPDAAEESLTLTAIQGATTHLAVMANAPAPGRGVEGATVF